MRSNVVNSVILWAKAYLTKDGDWSQDVYIIAFGADTWSNTALKLYSESQELGTPHVISVFMYCESCYRRAAL